MLLNQTYDLILVDWFLNEVTCSGSKSARSLNYRTGILGSYKRIIMYKRTPDAQKIYEIQKIFKAQRILKYR